MKPRTKEEAIELLKQVEDYIDDAVEREEDVSEVLRYVQGIAEENWMYIYR
jgi:hypothetical protein